MRPEGSTKDRQPIYKEEFNRLIDLMKHDKNIQKGTKLKLIRAYTLLYLTGCRVSEIINFTKDDIDTIAKHGMESLNNKTKMGRTRGLRFSEDGIKMLTKLDYSDVPANGVLFYANASDEPMGVSSFTRQLNTYLCEKLNKFYTTHSFRSGYITRIVEATGNIETARSLVGHKSIKTTIGYLSATPKQMDEAINKAFKDEAK